jgi:hypothetical protein
MTGFHIHLVSDATGETLKALAKAALVQFEHAKDTEEHLWTLVRTPGQMERVVQAIEPERSIVLYTLVDIGLRDILVRGCRKLGVTCISVLDPVIAALAGFLGEKAQATPGRQHELDAAYFARIDAMHYTMAHDDGQSTADLDEADIVLVGVSRTSKTPTSVYLANRGMKTANVPIVPGVALPRELETATRPLVVGLIASADRLVSVRRNRLLSLNERTATAYVDHERVKEELAYARKIFARHGWPVIDVTRRSIEETAAAVLNLHSRRQEALRKGEAAV